MAIKYSIPYKDLFDNQCVVDISNASYAGTPIVVRGVGSRACEIVRDCDDDPYTTIVNTKANINILQEITIPVDVLELQTAQDKDFTVTVTISGVIEFIGYLVPDGIQQTFQAAPYEINLVATDGLAALDTTPFSYTNPTGGRSILNHLRQVLFATSNLGLPLPIRWVNSLTNDQFPLEEDVFSGSMQWSSRGEGVTDYQGNNKSCMYVLDGLLKSMQCRIVQTGGRWVIWRINDVSTGQLRVRETPGTLDGYVIADLGIIDVNKTIGSKNRKPFMEDAILMTLPGLKSAKTTYTQEQRENILPNGNMDITSLGVPLYWSLLSPAGGTVQSFDSLSDARGNSVKVTTFTGQSNIFRLQSQLPIDTDILYSYINFGFKYSISSWSGVDADGYINWDVNPPFDVQVIYYTGSKYYYLNEFGFWTETNIKIKISTASLKIDDIAQIDFNAKQNIVMPLPDTTPIGRTSYPHLYVGFNLQPSLVIEFDDIYIKVEDNSDVYEGAITTSKNTASESYELPISSAHSGFYVSNLMTDFSQSGLEKFYSDAHLQQATLTEMNTHAILRNRYKSSLIFEGSIHGNHYQYDEIYTIPQFPGKKFLPLKSTWNTETNTTALTLIETRDDSISVQMNHYGNNDKTTLSN